MVKDKTVFSSKTMWFALAEVILALAHCVEANTITKEGIFLALAGVATAVLRKATKEGIK